MKFVSARQVGRSVIFTAEDGTQVIRSGGDPAWRTNNPGNLWPGNVAKRHQPIGKFDKRVVFPDYETGHAALVDSLKSTHWNKSLKEMIRVYAPEHENDTARYLRFLRSQTGVKDDRKIRELTSSEFEKLWRAIERFEGQKVGKVELIKSGSNAGPKRNIVQVRKNKKGTIVAYKIEGMGWVNKGRGIELTAQGKVSAVIATSRSGNLYLRAHRGDPDLENLG